MTNTKIEQDTKKRKPPRAGMGRPPGALNKQTKEIKEIKMEMPLIHIQHQLK